MTMANAPLWDGTVSDILLIWVSGEAKYFCKWGWTGFTDLPDRQSVEMPVQPSLQKYFRFHLTQITSISSAVPSPRGALAIVIDAGRDAVDAAASGACVMAGRGTY